MARTTARLTGLTGALLAGALVLAGCSDDSTHEGMSGMADSSPASASADSTDTSASFNDADVAFAQGMLPHHEGALELAQLAGDRAADPRVLDLATRIEAAQAPEIDTLTGWLDEWGAATDGSSSSAGTDGMDHSGHDTGGGMGMDTGALAAASGAEFDRMFLTQMIAHHEGAVKMAQKEAANGSNPEAVTLANTIIGDQEAEIQEMQDLLSAL